MVGVEIAMYKLHQFAMNNENTGSIISPIDQNSSNRTATIFLARPFVMSRTEIIFCGIRSVILLAYLTLTEPDRHLQMVWPDVYIRAHDAAERQRNSKCAS